jgi:peptidyl-prolyl cis-trans isomerase B (cyclophilin B)
MDRPTSSHSAAHPIRSCAEFAVLAVCAIAVGCGVAERVPEEESFEPVAETAASPQTHFEWPSGERPVAILRIRGMGDVHIALYPELAPETVENFTKLADEGFYVGTTFHRVIPGFAVQGGSPGSLDKDPYNDAAGGPGYTIVDEFSDAPHLRGAVSMANLGRTDTGGSQFFIVHQDSTGLDGRYAIFGRVVSGMEIVDAISETQLDKAGRWGAPDRPIENVVIDEIRIETSSAGQAASGAAPESDA